MKSHTLKRKMIPLQKVQLLLRKYLKEVRHDLGVSQVEMSQLTGFGISACEAMEKTAPIHPLVKRIADLQKLADLRGLDADVFVSLLLGSKNEDLEDSPFYREFCALVSEHMSEEEQQSLFSLLKENKFSEGSSALLRDYNESTDAGKRLYQKIKYLDDAGVELFDKHLDYIFGENKDAE